MAELLALLFIMIFIAIAVKILGFFVNLIIAIVRLIF